MKLVLPQSLFKEVSERVKFSSADLSLASQVVERIREAGKTPLLVLPEVSPVKLSPSITFEEGVKLLSQSLKLDLPEGAVPISFPAFSYGRGWEVEAFATEVFALRLITALLSEGALSSALLVASPYLERDEALREFLYSVSKRLELGGVVLYRLEGEAVRDFFAPRIVAPTGEVLGFTRVERKKFPVEVEFEELPLVVVGSPLRNYPSDRDLKVPPVKMVRVGMSQLRSNFVLQEDLLEGKEITDEEERKKVWSAVLNREEDYAPYLKKGDILLPVKREKNFNVAVVCQELPSNSPLFVPKDDLVIVRSRAGKLDFNLMHSLAQVLLAELKRLSGDRFRELSGGRAFSVSDLRGILGELFVDDGFREVLESGTAEQIIEVGRRSLREAVKRYFGRKTKFAEV